MRHELYVLRDLDAARKGADGRKREVRMYLWSGIAEVLTDAEAVLDRAVVVRLPLRTKFRGVTVREAMIFVGPAGWGEFSPFIEYGDQEAAGWLLAGLEAAYLGPPPAVRAAVAVNATVPAVPAEEVPGILARYPGATTAKVKVAESGQTLAEDVARVSAVRAHVERVRIDANGAWSVDEAVAAIAAIGSVEYVEQPCASVADLAAVRRRVSVPIAADESIRKADDPFRVLAADAADVAVLKVAPLGGMRSTLALAEQLGIEVVISSALDTAVGMAAGVAAAASLPALDYACGLGTGSLFVADVAPPFLPNNGMLTPRWFGSDDVDVLPGAVAVGGSRRQWWSDRARRCLQELRRRVQTAEPS